MECVCTYSARAQTKNDAFEGVRWSMGEENKCLTETEKKTSTQVEFIDPVIPGYGAHVEATVGQTF